MRAVSPAFATTAFEFDAYSGHDEIRHEDLSLGLRSEQQGKDKARRSDAGADQHRDREAETVMAGEPGKHQRDEAAEYRPLVVAEGARRRAYLGREALGEVGRVLAIDRLAEQALQHKANGDPGEVRGEQIEGGDKDRDGRGDDHRPASAKAIGEPAPET